MTNRAASKQLSNIMKKLETAIAEGRYYDAEQVYKTLYSRHMAAKKYDDIIPLLLSGSVLLLQHGEYNAGTELAQLLLEVFTAAGKTATSELVGSLKQIFQGHAAGAHHGKISFGKAAVKWIEKHGGSKPDIEEFYYLLAKAHVEEREFVIAQKYYLKCSRDDEFGLMVQQWLEQGNAAERDLFVARAILLALCNGNLKQANALHDRLAPVVNVPNASPLMNFIRFLLLTLERDAFPLFETLRKRYSIALQRDPALQQFLDTIAQVFYKVQPRTAQAGLPGGMLGELVKSLMGGSAAARKS